MLGYEYWYTSAMYEEVDVPPPWIPVGYYVVRLMLLSLSSLHSTLKPTVHEPGISTLESLVGQSRIPRGYLFPFKCWNMRLCVPLHLGIYAPTADNYILTTGRPVVTLCGDMIWAPYIVAK